MVTEIEVAQIFAKSGFFKVIIAFRLLTSAISLICMTVLELNQKFACFAREISYIPSSKLVAHKSLRMLLNFHGFWTFLLCLSTFFESFERTIVHFNLKTPADLLLSSNQCFLRMIPVNFGMLGSVLSLLAMSFERYEASRNLSKYETSPRISGKIFVLIHISMTCLGVFFEIRNYGSPTPVAHCTVVSKAAKLEQTLMAGIAFLSELFTIYFYTKLLRRNESVQAEQSLQLTLSERYQLGENIRVLRLLLPIVIFHTSITIAAIVAYAVFELAKFPEEMYPIFEDATNMIYLQGIAMPLAFYVRHRYKLKQSNRIFSTNMTTGEELITVHDGVITRGW